MLVFWEAACRFWGDVGPSRGSHLFVFLFFLCLLFYAIFTPEHRLCLGAGRREQKRRCNVFKRLFFKTSFLYVRNPQRVKVRIAFQHSSADNVLVTYDTKGYFIHLVLCHELFFWGTFSHLSEKRWSDFPHLICLSFPFHVWSVTVNSPSLKGRVSCDMPS